MSSEESSSKAGDLVKKLLTIGVGTIFLTEESVRNLVSEFKLPKELVKGILESGNKTKNEFLQNFSQEIIGRIMERVDPKEILEEIFEKNEIELNVKVRLIPKKSSSD